MEKVLYTTNDGRKALIHPKLAEVLSKKGRGSYATRDMRAVPVAATPAAPALKSPTVVVEPNPAQDPAQAVGPVVESNPAQDPNAVAPAVDQAPADPTKGPADATPPAPVDTAPADATKQPADEVKLTPKQQRELARQQARDASK